MYRSAVPGNDEPAGILFQGFAFEKREKDQKGFQSFGRQPFQNKDMKNPEKQNDDGFFMSG